jgi:transposase
MAFCLVPKDIVIANILEGHRNSVSSWIHAWERAGISELSDQPRSGAPSQLNDNDIKRLKQLITEYPQSPKTILAQFAKATKKTLSMSTWRRVVKKSRLRWKRTRKSLKSKRYPQQFAVASLKIQKLKQQQQAGKIDLFYFDESGFSLTPVVPYAYQPLGETIEIPASLSRKRLNVLGFYSLDNRLESFCFEVNIDSSIVVASFNEFCRKITKKSLLSSIMLRFTPAMNL